MAVQLIINGKQADIFSSVEFPVSINKQVEDIYNFEQIKGSGGNRTLSIPATATNNDIFYNVDANQVQGVDVRSGMPCEIRIDTIAVEVGTVFLQEVKLVNDKWSFKGQSYELLFIADNGEWFDLLADVTLNELSYANFVLQDASISALEDVTGATNDFCFALIKWREWETAGVVNRYEFTPCLFINRIIEKAFNSIGYTVDSSFLTADFGERQIIPIPLKPYGEDFFTNEINATARMTAVQIGVIPTTLAVIFDDDFTAPNFDAGGFYNAATGLFTAPYDGEYRFSFSVEMQNVTAVGVPSFAVAFFKNGVTLVPAVPNFFAPVANGDILSIDVTVSLLAGETMQAAVSAAVNVLTYNLQNGIFDMRMLSMDWVFGAEIFWSYLLPQYNLVDLINGFASLFDLKVSADAASKVVTIENRNDFYNVESDKTFRIDARKGAAKQVPDIAKNYLFKYKEDSNDPNVENLGLNTNLPYGAAQYTTGITSGGTEVIENPFFAATAHIRDQTIAGFAGTDIAPQIPLITNTVHGEPIVIDNKFDFEPRILYFAGRSFMSPYITATSKFGSVSIGIASPITRSIYPCAFMTNYYDDIGLLPSIAFGSVAVNGNVTVDGLLRNYFLKHLATIRRGLVIETAALFNIADLLAFNFREKWAVLGNKYYLQEINGLNFTRQDSSKVVLVEEYDPVQDDIDNIESSINKGYVINL